MQIKSDIHAQFLSFLTLLFVIEVGTVKIREILYDRNSMTLQHFIEKILLDNNNKHVSTNSKHTHSNMYH